MRFNRPPVPYQPNYLAYVGTFVCGVAALLILVVLDLQWAAEKYKPVAQQQSEATYILANVMVISLFILCLCAETSLMQTWVEDDFIVRNCIIFQQRFDMRQLVEVKRSVHQIKLISPTGKFELHSAYMKDFEPWLNYIDFYVKRELWK